MTKDITFSSYSLACSNSSPVTRRYFSQIPVVHLPTVHASQRTSFNMSGGGGEGWRRSLYGEV